jgi:pimeloyl-ACP methyl ester carboxylesterase
VIGSPSSAFQALLLAARRPQRLLGAVAEEPPVIPILFSSTPPSLQDLVSAFIARPAAALALASFGAKTMGPATAAFAAGDDERGLMLFARAVFGVEGIATMEKTRLDRMRDNLAPHKAAMLRTVPAAGHFMHEDNPEETARLIREFIADLEPR